MNKEFLYSFLIGFITASPFGPMGLLCLRRTFSQGFTAGMISALGISCAYTFWAYSAVHGLASVPGWIEKENQPIELTIGLFILLYGLNAIFNSPNTNYPSLNKKNGVNAFFSTFFVVFLNPATFIMFTAFFALFGIARSGVTHVYSLIIAFFVFLGAMSFWLIVSRTIHNLRNKIEERLFSRISRLSAFVIAAFGVTILLHSIN